MLCIDNDESKDNECPSKQKHPSNCLIENKITNNRREYRYEI